jgi:hypothetical protein
VGMAFVVVDVGSATGAHIVAELRALAAKS